MAVMNLMKYGFVKAPNEDFSDDGNYFKGYYYDPEKKGDKRFRTSKLISDGDAYISVRYYDDETGKTTYFDDLNGVRYDYAIDHIKELTDKIDAFKAKLDAGEIKPRELSDEDIQNIKDKAKQLMSLSDMSYYQALDTIYKKLGIDSYELRKEIRDKISKDVEYEARNAKEDNPAVVKALAKKLLQDVMKAMKGTSGSYNSRGKWTQGNAPKSLEDALEIDSDVGTYSFDPESKELIDAGVAENKTFSLSDLTDANQKRIRDWVKHKIETLYDFDSYLAQEVEENLEETLEGLSPRFSVYEIVRNEISSDDIRLYKEDDSISTCIEYLDELLEDGREGIIKDNEIGEFITQQEIDNFKMAMDKDNYSDDYRTDLTEEKTTGSNNKNTRAERLKDFINTYNKADINAVIEESKTICRMFDSIARENNLVYSKDFICPPFREDLIIKLSDKTINLSNLTEDIVKAIEPLDPEVAREADSIFASDDPAHPYRMLGRLESDCKYILGAMKDTAKDEKISLEGINKFLWFHDIDKQIALMKTIYERLDEKPEWISMEEILNYGDQLRSLVREEVTEGVKDNLKKVYTYEDLQGIKIPNYFDTWSAFDKMQVGNKTYYILENDEYGDETWYLVVDDSLKEIYETYDDIETCLRDEDIIEWRK